MLRADMCLVYFVCSKWKKLRYTFNALPEVVSQSRLIHYIYDDPISCSTHNLFLCQSPKPLFHKHSMENWSGIKLLKSKEWDDKRRINI